MDTSRLKEMFHSQKETFEAVLGQGYAASVLQGNFSKALLVLSDRRLYFKGKVLIQASTGGFIRVKSTQTVNVRDIRGINFIDGSNPLHLGAGIFFALATLAIWGLALSKESAWAGLASFPFLIFALSFLASYFVNKGKLMVIEYAGGAIAVPCRFYTEMEIQDFQRKVSNLRDRMEGDE